MAIDEAIKILEREREYNREMEKNWLETDRPDCLDHLPDPKVWANGHRLYAEALDMAIDALKEQKQEVITMDEVIKNLYMLFDAAWEENMNGRGNDITTMVTTFVPDAIQNLQAYEAICKNLINNK